MKLGPLTGQFDLGYVITHSTIQPIITIRHRAEYLRPFTVINLFPASLQLSYEGPAYLEISNVFLDNCERIRKAKHIHTPV